MLYDSHTHLNSPELFPDFEEYVQNFKDAWWKKLINVWVDKERSIRWFKIQEKFPNICYSSAWFHPSESIFNKDFRKDPENYLKSAEEFIQESIDKWLIVAIWECGLDYHYNVDPLAISLQKILFKTQLDLSERNKIPVIVHSRDAFEDSIEILKKYKDIKINLHCWWYGPEEIEVVQSTFPNIRIWFDWNISYKNANKLRESLIKANIENILIETDAPYLSPQVVRKERNQPANIRYIYEYISNLLNIQETSLEKQIEKNFKELFVV